MHSRQRTIRRWTRVASLAAVAVLLVALPALARQIIIHDFDESIVVNKNGTIDVTETIQAEFQGSWHGLYRSIPTEYTTPEGLNYTLDIDNIRVTDENGNSLKVEKSSSGRYMKLKIYEPGAEDVTRTIVIHYEVLDAIRYMEDHDELYWGVTGTEWDNPILRAAAHVTLPEGVTGLKAVAYTGALGSRAEDATVNVSGNTVSITTNRALAYREGLTIAVGFDKGLVQQPSTGTKIWRTLMSNKPFAIPLLALIGMIWVWWTRGRDPEAGSITVQYEPPDQLTPGECGTLIDNSVDMRDITATLVDLAVKGYLTIEQKDESHMMGLSHSKAYTFHLKKPPAEWTSLRPHEYALLAALFDDGSTLDVPMTALQNSFYKSVPQIKDRIFDALMKDNYYKSRPNTMSAGYIGAGFVIGFLFVFGSSALQNITGITRFTWALTGIFTGLIICVGGYFMSGRTLLGAKTRAKVVGFEDFLGRVEKDRIERLELTPDLFEKYLPFAMALGVEKKWAGRFAAIAMSSPAWFVGPYGTSFNPVFFTNDMSLMSSQTGSAMVSSPRSSGGSGFGGGGFSGGGFGGGGGGGF